MIRHSVQTNGNPLTLSGREEVVSQEGAPTWWFRKMPRRGESGRCPDVVSQEGAPTWWCRKVPRRGDSGRCPDVVSQEDAPTWWVRKVPRQAYRVSFLSPVYRLTLENELHFSMDRNIIEIVKESYLGDKFHYSSWKKNHEGVRYEMNCSVYQCRQPICQQTCSSKPFESQWRLTLCTTSCNIENPCH